MEETYEVALWRWWPSLFPDRVGAVHASDALSAVCWLMQCYRLEEVAHAAAHIVGRSEIERWDYLFMPLASVEDEVLP
jgi:hypothetical protein